jgi:hypothetical protein
MEKAKSLSQMLIDKFDAQGKEMCFVSILELLAAIDEITKECCNDQANINIWKEEGEYECVLSTYVKNAMS